MGCSGVQLFEAEDKEDWFALAQSGVQIDCYQAAVWVNHSRTGSGMGCVCLRVARGKDCGL